MYSTEVTSVIEALRHIDRPTRFFSTADEVRAVIASVDVGACRLVTLNDHAVRLRDESWNVVLGIELTDRGVRAAAQLAGQ